MVQKLAHTYRSPLLFCDLEVRTLITVADVTLGYGEGAVSAHGNVRVIEYQVRWPLMCRGT